MNEDLMKKAKSAKSAEELRAIAEGAGLKLTEEAANECYAKLHGTGELEDEELDNVAGGGCGSKKESIPTQYVNGGEFNSFNIECPSCHARPATLQSAMPSHTAGKSIYMCICPQCGQEFNIVEGD